VKQVNEYPDEGPGTLYYSDAADVLRKALHED
jgi:hypothetical protein